MPYNLEVSNVTAEVLGQGTTEQVVRTEYRLTNHGPDTMPHNGAYVRATAEVDTGAFAAQAHWYERPLAAGAHEDIHIHLQVDPGSAGLNLYIYDPDNN